LLLRGATPNKKAPRPGLVASFELRNLVTRSARGNPDTAQGNNPGNAARRRYAIANNVQPADQPVGIARVVARISS
jgi:hypothetical protein